MFSIFVRLLTSPKLEDLQRKELESAQKELLAAQTARDYAEAIAAEDEGPACCRLRSDTLLGRKCRAERVAPAAG